MIEPAAEIERVVRQVLAEMGLLPAEKPPSPPAPLPQAGEGREGDWTVAGRVVALADLPAVWNGVRRVVVIQRAVVTPAVRDELQRRNVALEFADPQPCQRLPDQGQVLLVSAGSYDPGPLAGALGDDGFLVRTERVNCLIAATGSLVGHVAGGTSLGLLVTRHAAAALCLANRRAGVRAVLGSRPETVPGDAEAVGANVLVVDPAAGGLFALRQIARAFLRGGPRPCPRVFERELG